MTPASLARWLKEVLSLAGVIDAKARSVLSVGSSTAAQGPQLSGDSACGNIISQAQ